MRTSWESDGNTTSFILADVEPEYEATVRHLYYQPIESGFAKSYPADRHHLDRVFTNFERYAPQMVLQAAERQPIPWEQALEALIQIIGDEPINWWIIGSGALAVRGIDVEPHDIDLVTDEDGAERLYALLENYVVEPLQSGWIWRAFGRAFLHARVEWIGGVSDSVDDAGPTEFGATARNRLEVVQWHGTEIRVPPLDIQLAICEQRELTERSKKIRHFMAASY